MAVNINLDVRGLSCPEPVILTKKVLSADAPSSLTVLADNKVAAENIKRLSKSMNYRCAIQEENGSFHITISKEA